MATDLLHERVALLRRGRVHAVVPDLRPPSYPDITAVPIPDFAWPLRAACGVTIGWHVDGEAGPIGSDRRSADHVAAISEPAYGVTTAMPRILAMHRELEIPATFFVPAHVAERHPDMLEAILADGHEIAHHGYMHENVFGLCYEDEKAIFVHASEQLRRLTGRAPLGWSAPSWGVNQQTLEILCELGMRYDASLMEYDRIHWIKTRRGHVVELPISMTLDDWALFGASLFPSGSAVNAPAAAAQQIWKEEFDGLRHYGGLFNTTFHPNLTGRPGRLLMLRELFTYMRSFDDVWWGTCEQAASLADAGDPPP